MKNIAILLVVVLGIYCGVARSVHICTCVNLQPSDINLYRLFVNDDRHHKPRDNSSNVAARNGAYLTACIDIVQAERGNRAALLQPQS